MSTSSTNLKEKVANRYICRNKYIWSLAADDLIVMTAFLLVLHSTYISLSPRHSYWGANKPGMYHPHLVACVLPEGYKDQIPQTVSLVANKCDTASNNLRVVYDRPEEKRDFAVCVKGMDFLHVDLSVRLVEWIELLKLLGADKIFIYELHVHPNMSKVLKHYQNEGSVRL